MWQLCWNLDFIVYLSVAVYLSVLLAVTEVAGAFRDVPQGPARAIFHFWAIPHYMTYALITVLLALALCEYQLIKPGWTSAILLGLGGPAIFKTRITLVRSISGSGAISATMERMITGIQQFCFEQISRSFAHERIYRKEQLTHQPEDELLRRLRTVSEAGEYQKFIQLIEERREQDPSSTRAFIVELIETKDSNALHQPLEGETNNP